jgi:hypothetical protein
MKATRRSEVCLDEGFETAAVAAKVCGWCIIIRRRGISLRLTEGGEIG